MFIRAELTHSNATLFQAGNYLTLVGLHGTNEAGSVGHSASHCCLRVSNAAIAQFAQALPVGTPIVIVG